MHTKDKKNPAAFNQALMDFGATICKPQQPLCVTCILKNKCIALQNGSVNQLPVKEKSITKKIVNKLANRRTLVAHVF